VGRHVVLEDAIHKVITACLEALVRVRVGVRGERKGNESRGRGPVYTSTWAGVQLSSSRDRTRDTVVPSDLVSFTSEKKTNKQKKC
jgi:hypothetical protein